MDSSKCAKSGSVLEVQTKRGVDNTFNSSKAAEQSSPHVFDDASPNREQNAFHADPNIIGTNDLTFACAALRANDEGYDSLPPKFQDPSHDKTLASAIDESASNLSRDIACDVSSTKLVNVMQVEKNSCKIEHTQQDKELHPQRQSTTLATFGIVQPNLEELKFTVESVNDVCKSTFDAIDGADSLVSATSEIFQDPSNFDFLMKRGNAGSNNRLRRESLHAMFDPLFENTSMLPRENNQPIDAKENGKCESTPADRGNPWCNPAVVAINKLLVYSIFCTSVKQKNVEAEKTVANKEQTPEESKFGAPLVTYFDIRRELEFVRTIVLELIEEREKRKKVYAAALEKRELVYQDRIKKLQAHMAAQKLKRKSLMKMIVDKCEKFISQLRTEREKGYTALDQEITKLEIMSDRLGNTEIAFRVVYDKYEKLRGVISTYKNNELALKKSIEENSKIIKDLKTRYDQLETHARTQLENANIALETTRKQNADEIAKLREIVRKAELKNNSLVKLVEQKTKENEELAKLRNEMMAKARQQNPE